MSSRSVVTLDVDAVASNVRLFRAHVRPAELWAVVKADGYGHGARSVAEAALGAGASALCVATAGKAESLRSDLPGARIIVLGPASDEEHGLIRAAEAELVVGSGDRPAGIPLHLKVDTGMGRSGLRVDEVGDAGRDRGAVIGLMTHLASADSSDQDAFTEQQLDRFEELAAATPGVTRHAANSAATLRFTRAYYDAVRCGIAIYGLSPFVDRPAGVELRPALSWRSRIRVTKTLRAGESTGYGRSFVASEPTRIGLVPIGYADGFARALRDAHVLVSGERCRVLGWPSMDSFTVALPDGLGEDAEVTILGDSLPAEEHAASAGTINYEFVCGISRAPARCEWVVQGG
jgi:alanine racemase